ncbi:MAG TPA: winged helix-turn-helix transcriptional regulator [Solirubrobacteraceae bacterium]|jgi:DNA-binding HxlR family transcriptional regulator|nr:winged helix-turn-helix transcriptional regulator [Solirubrobacteraceae bacterium]
MARRTYGDRCGIARALDLVGERWALLVVRELLLGPKRFTDLRAGLPNIGPDVLAQRLRDLEASGIVARATLPPPAASHVYELTDWGRELEGVVLGLGRWGSRAPAPSADAPLGPDAAMLALKTMFAPTDGLTARYEVRFGDNVYDVRVDGARLDIARGPSERPDATIATDPGTLATVLWHDGNADAIAVDGDRDAFARFLGLFRKT